MRRRPARGASAPRPAVPTIAELWGWFDTACQRVDIRRRQTGETPILVNASEHVRRYELLRPDGIRRFINVAPTLPTSRGAMRCGAYIGGSALPRCLFITPTAGAWILAASGDVFTMGRVERLVQETFGALDAG